MRLLQPKPHYLMSAPTHLTTPALSRRGFFARLGAGAAAVAVLPHLAGCDSDDPDPMGDDVVLDFSDDFGVLNYAYALEQLEAAFYAMVVDNLYDDISSDEQAIMEDIARHEAIHRDFFFAAISGAGGSPIPELTPDFGAVDFDSRTSVLATAQTFEDLGVAAYNGAGKYLASATYLTIAGKIVSVEARHAAVISDLIQANTIAAAGVVNSDGLDRALEPSAVLGAASAFIQDTIVLTNVPS